MKEDLGPQVTSILSVVQVTFQDTELSFSLDPSLEPNRWVINTLESFRFVNKGVVILEDILYSYYYWWNFSTTYLIFVNIFLGSYSIRKSLTVDGNYHRKTS